MILGWNECAATIIRELDHYVAKGSRVLVVADVDEQQVRREDLDRDMAAAGLAPVASYDFLPEQYFVVYGAGR